MGGEGEVRARRGRCTSLNGEHYPNRPLRGYILTYIQQ